MGKWNECSNFRRINGVVNHWLNEKYHWKLRNFINELPKIKEVYVLVEKLDDSEMALRGFKNEKLHKVQNSLVQEEKTSFYKKAKDKVTEQLIQELVE